MYQMLMGAGLMMMGVGLLLVLAYAIGLFEQK